MNVICKNLYNLYRCERYESKNKKCTLKSKTTTTHDNDMLYEQFFSLFYLQLNTDSAVKEDKKRMSPSIVLY